MAISAQELDQLYLAYFGRPADPGGRDFYTLDSAATVQSVAAAFSASPESQALYGAGFDSSVINNIYRNLFNRDAEQDGLDYWTAEVVAGRLTAAGAAFAILVGGQNQDRITVENKLQVCAAFTEALDTAAERAGYAGAAAADLARDFIGRVDDGSLSPYWAGLSLQPILASVVSLGTFSSANQHRVSAALQNGATVDMQALGKRDLWLGQGIALEAQATVRGLAAGARVEITGELGDAATLWNAGRLALILNGSTASDFLHITFKPAYLDDEGGLTEAVVQEKMIVNLAGVDVLTLHSTSTVSGEKPPGASTRIGIEAPGLSGLVVTGDQALELWDPTNPFSYSLVYQLQTVDATALDAPAVVQSDLVPDLLVAFSCFLTRSGLHSILGSRTSSNELWGTGNANQIIGGNDDDVLFGMYGADLLTGGGGHDHFYYEKSSDSGLGGSDTITDFSPNTYGRGTGGQVDSRGATLDQGKLTGDVLNFTWLEKSGVKAATVTGETAARDWLLAADSAEVGLIAAVLDTDSGRLLVDIDSDGLADLRINLVGVTAISEAAFAL